MKKSPIIFVLLASVIFVSSSSAAVKRHVLASASSLKSDSPPTLVSPRFGDMPILQFFWKFIVKEPNLEEQLRPREPYVPYDPPGESGGK